MKVILRAEVRQRVKARRRGGVRLAIDEQADRFRVPKNGDGTSQSFFEHEHLACNLLRAFTEGLACQAKVITRVAENTRRHYGRVPFGRRVEQIHRKDEDQSRQHRTITLQRTRNYRQDSREAEEGVQGNSSE